MRRRGARHDRGGTEPNRPRRRPRTRTREPIDQKPGSLRETIGFQFGDDDEDDWGAKGSDPPVDAVTWSRFQFAFTVTYHYLFPQLTMGLALVIVLFKAIALRTGDARYHDAARFWGRIFGIN